MEKYHTLARRYRPQTFKEVIGQEAIVTTIKNSIKFKRIAQAYLFSGSRGTGKTTIARLFAKALNCKNLSEDLEPCNVCRSCTDILSSRSLDVIEIDGASNRGIDDIRQINETIGYAATNGQYKIYIIDEVHMLTKEAFNALLKTLEEPPENIKFFFATTEAHKVLPTVISRCQRFELNRIPTDALVKKLEDIAKDLKKEIKKEALYLIANFSEGSLRDAESILDQILCYQEGVITLDVINQSLGFIPQDYFFDLDRAYNEQNILFAFTFVENIFQSGKDFSYILEELIEHYRYLLLFKMNDQTPLSDLSEELIQKYKNTVDLYSNEDLFFILDFLIEALQTIQKMPFKRVFMEALILKIIKSKIRIPIEALTKRLVELEKSLTNEKIEAKKEIPQLVKIPFTLKRETEKKEILEPKVVNNNIKTPLETTTKKSQSHYDNLLNFAKIELEGSFKENKF
jgi:DNA polymerase III subunit gamma/tau